MTDEEFVAFFTAMHPALLRYGMRQLDVDTAQEVALDTLRVVWEKKVPAPGTDDEQRQLVSLTYRIMDGLIRNSQRSSRRRDRLVATLSAQRPVDQAGLADHFDPGRVLDALAQLPEADQKMLSLLIDGYGVSEIAAILGRSPGAVSTRLSRARTKLRGLMAGEDSDG